MLLSHPHRFLFVHLAKTGGTSIRAALSRQRWRDPYYWPAYLCHRISGCSGHRIGCKIPRHAPVIVAKEMLPPTLFEDLFKFGFVRNPWDRMVSAYYHFKRERQDILRQHRIEDVAQFVDWLLDVPLSETRRSTLIAALRRPQFDHLVDLEGEYLVDFIGRYERLHDDFEYVLRHLSLKSISLPHKRRSQRQRDYRSCFTDRLAERVAKHFAADLSAFDYQFDCPSGNDGRVDVGHSQTVTRPRLLDVALNRGRLHVKS